MKALYGLLLSIPIVGVLLIVGLWLFLIGMTVYGLVLAFSASIVLGLIVLFLEPSPLILVLAMFFWDKDLAQMIVNFLNQ